MKKKCYTIQSRMTTAQIIRLLSGNVEEGNRWSSAFRLSNNNKPLIGLYDKDGFELVYNPRYGKKAMSKNNGSAAIANGTFEPNREGTAVKITIRVLRSVLIFEMIWVSVALYGIGAIVLSGTDSVISKLIGVFISLAILLLGCGVVNWVYKREVEALERVFAWAFNR